jgi:hypothetical protein
MQRRLRDTMKNTIAGAHDDTVISQGRGFDPCPAHSASLQRSFSLTLVEGLAVDGEHDGDVSAGRVRIWTALVCSEHQFVRLVGGDVRCV